MTLMGDLKESLQETFPDYTKLIEEWESENNEPGWCARWLQMCQMPLKKGSAKYMKAVQSITDCAPCIYHSVAYRDIDAILFTYEAFLKPLPIKEWATTESMTEEGLGIFWECMDELCTHSYTFKRTDPPVVPTPAQLESDIRRRKGTTARPQLQTGMMEAWQVFSKMRGSNHTETDDLPAKMKSFLSDRTDMLSLCNNREESILLPCLLKYFPYVGSESLTDEQWEQLGRILSFTTMESAIPKGMMQGIEDVASNIVAGMGPGGIPAVGAMDMQSIAKKVLQGVSPKDMSTFTSNLDKIIPALQNM